jgi:hypothetical protein
MKDAVILCILRFQFSATHVYAAFKQSVNEKK